MFFDGADLQASRHEGTAFAGHPRAVRPGGLPPVAGAARFPVPRASGVPLASAPGRFGQRLGGASAGRSANRAGQSDPRYLGKTQNQGAVMTETAPAPPFLMDLTRVKSIRACHPAPRLRAVRSGLTICHWQIVRAALTPPAGAFAPAQSGADGFPGPCASGVPLANAPGTLWQRPGGPSTGRSADRAGQSDPRQLSKIRYQRVPPDRNPTCPTFS
jgi:hypothetical protein